MKIKTTQFPGLVIIEKNVFADSRGYFFESYNKVWFDLLKLDFTFVQDNVSMSTIGVLRGLHFQQQPFAQAKLVQVLQGEVFDVVVDLREDSPTFKKWHAEIISESNNKAMFIPEGFAHGFLTLSSSALFHYKCSNLYHPESSKIIRWDDEDIDIMWPNKPTSISDQDSKGLSLKDYLKLKEEK
jgi:dTDP-4-dehydrorhamnose 3,5-epimerase